MTDARTEIPYRLAERLYALGCLDKTPSEMPALTAAQASDLIRMNLLEPAVFGRIPRVDGRVATFEQAYRYGYQCELDGGPLKQRKKA